MPDHGRFPLGVFAVLLFAFTLPGCSDSAAQLSDANADDGGSNAAARVWEVVPVKTEAHVETVELPGASVEGYETTCLMAKVGGYVKTIRRVAVIEEDGRRIQISDAGDNPVESANIEVRIEPIAPAPSTMLTVPGGASAATLEELRSATPAAAELYEKYRDRLAQVDIGSQVTAGTVLAVIDVPEMLDEIAKHEAMVAQSERAVVQSEAAVKQARADVAQREAEIKQAQAGRSEKQAMVKFKSTKQQRMNRLVGSGSVGRDSLDEAQFELDAAKASLESVDAEVDTARAMKNAADAGVEKAQADLESSKSHVDVEKAELSRLRTLARYSKITAPFDGVITERMVDRGDFVRPAESNSSAASMFRITRLDRVRITASVPNTTAPRVQTGQKVLLHSVGGLPGVTVEGDVSRSSGSLEAKSRMMRIEADFKNPLEHPQTGEAFTLRPGLYGTLRIIVKDWKDLPVVPASAVATDSTGQPYVMKVGADNKCHKQPVEVIYNDAHQVGLAGGVKAGDQVVRSDVDQLEDGKQIETKRPAE